MEAGPFFNAVYEIADADRFPVGEAVNFSRLPIDLGIIHYASDTPYTQARTLGARGLSYYGMDSTYASSLAILRRILGSRASWLDARPAVRNAPRIRDRSGCLWRRRTARCRDLRRLTGIEHAQARRRARRRARAADARRTRTRVDSELEGLAPAAEPVLHGRLAPLGPGKESVTGHWELMGVVPKAPLPTYPYGFPDEVVSELEHATEQRFCCNRPYSGTQVLEDFGEHHLRTRELILYTSADSVLQIAAHHDVLDEPALHRLLRDRARGDARRACGRPRDRAAVRRLPGRLRAHGRPPRLRAGAAGAVLSAGAEDAGVAVHGVGKIRDLFAGVGIDAAYPGATNEQAIASTSELVRSLDSGLVFVNLVDTDQLFGHRHDVPGFVGALRAIDTPWPAGSSCCATTTCWS